MSTVIMPSDAAVDFDLDDMRAGQELKKKTNRLQARLSGKQHIALVVNLPKRETASDHSL